MTKARKSLEPWLKDEVNFYGHQVDGVRYLIQRRDALVADEMGLGKSLQAIATFATDVKMGWGDTALVVAPVSLKDNWANEFDKFTRIPYTVLGQRVNGAGKIVKMERLQRVQQIVDFALTTGPRVMIVNYEQVVTHLGELNAVGFHLVIFDEVHMLGNSESKRTQACLKLKARRRLPMTGTPVLSQVQNLWAILMLIDRRTPKYHTFMNRHAVYGGFNGREITGIKNKDHIHEVLGGLMLRRLKKNVLDLPPVDKIPVYVGLTDEQQKLYDEVVNEMQLTTAFDPENPLEVENALTKMLRLKQICSSTFAFTGEDHSNKLDEVVAKTLELMDNGHKVVVFTQFRDTLELFNTRLAKARKPYPVKVWQLHGDVAVQDRFSRVEQWSTYQGPAVMAAMIQVAYAGFNMTAARHGIFIDKTYTPKVNDQAIDRMHRIGQQKTQPVTVWEFITRGSVEERIEEICIRKEGTFNELIEEVDWKKRVVEEVLKTSGGIPTPSAPHAQMTIGDLASALRE